MTEDSSQRKGTPPAGLGIAKKYAREGSSRHKPGWDQEERALPEGARVPPRKPKGSIPRTTVAEQLRKRLAEHGEE
jgi:hypothetical protein